MRLNFPGWTFGLALLFFLQPAAAQTHGSVADEKNRDIAKAWIALLNLQDTNALEKLYADSCKLYSPNWEGPVEQPSGAKTVYSRYFHSTPDLRHEIIRILSTDSSVVIEYSSQGTFLNPEKGVPQSWQGKKYRLVNCAIMDIRNGKISRQSTYFDQVSFLRQVGFFDSH
jgi:steroid delta-isomerase-like uncharacterized protein